VNNNIIHDWIRHHSVRRPDHVALVDYETGYEITYKNLNDKIDACALFIKDKYKIAAGDRVATLAQNCVEIFIVQFACARLRAIFLPMNWRLADQELDYITSDASPKVVFSDERFFETAHSLSQRTGALSNELISADSEFSLAINECKNFVVKDPPRFDDIWHILYTSGTTGRPKGAQLSHGQNLLQCQGLGSEYSLTNESVGLTYTPTFHASGLFMFSNPTLLQGGKTILMRQFDAKACLAIMKDADVKVTHTLAIPTNLLMIRNLDDFSEVNFDGLIIGSGGMPVPVALIEEFASHGARIPQVWGMTELCGVSTSLPAEDYLRKAGSCGPPLMNVEISIIDSEKNHIDKPDTVGEIVARGPMVMRGYWGMEHLNDEFFIDDGWFRTGDAGKIDTDGYLTISGRWKDMYISGGENVYPAEVEEIIYQMSEVHEVAVIGIPHDLWGETGRALVVLKPEMFLSEDKVIEFCKSHLAGYKVPKSVIFVDDLPHSANGKIQKSKLNINFSSDKVAG
tara:strand:- start:9682 stop:11220 length:1539 start_codon:yes stop_codon:yes gene_type:complete